MKKVLGLLFLLINLTFVAQVQIERNTNNAPSTKNELLDSMMAAPSIYQLKVTEQKTKKSAVKTQKVDAVSMEQKSSFITAKKNATYQSTQRTPTKEQQQQMDEAVKFYQKTAPDSYEYHYYKFVAGNYDVQLVSHLYDAKRLNAKSIEVHTQLAAYYFIIENKETLASTLKFLYENGKIESDMLRFAKHILSSVGQHETLLLHGFDDMLSVLYLQVNEGFRKDVEVISLDFLQSEHYRQRLAKKGFQVPNKSVVDVDFVKEFYKTNESKKINLSLTVPKAYVESAINDFELIGLVFTYKNKQANAFQENATLLEEFKKLGNIDAYRSEKVKNISSNYLPMLLMLRNQYETFGNKDKVSELDELIERVGVQCRKNKLIKSYK
jgi:hypothetical protein